MWAQALVRHRNKTHQRTVKNKLSHNRLKATRVDMVVMKKKKKTQLKLPQTLIDQISVSHQKQRK